MPNVHRLGYRPYEELPAYLGAFDAGLLPAVINAYTRSMFPMKFYEYLASGLRVVSTPLPFAGHDHPGIEIGEGAAEFSAAISRALASGRLSPDESRAAVGENTWEARLHKMLAVAGLDGRAAP
jgi:glycosyltransferase involved in cell wall biosynthesis